MSNSVISFSQMLVSAMVMVRNADPGPCELMADFFLPVAAIVSSLHDFTEDYLRPQIDAALEHRQPLVDRTEFKSDEARARRGEDVCYTHEGVSGRFVRYYDLESDRFMNRIRIRVGLIANAKESLD
jgi:hypothetical protein